MAEVVIESRRDPRSGSIIHTLDMDGKPETREYSKVCAGLAWPSPTSPACYVMLGMESPPQGTRFQGVIPQQPKLIVLAERTVDSIFLGDVVDVLADDVIRLGCGSVFAEIDVDDQGSFIDKRSILFRELLHKSGCPASLQRAPHTETARERRGESLQILLSLVKLYLTRGELVLPEESIARHQLKTASLADLEGHEEAEARLYGARALGYAVAACHRSGWYPLAGYRPKRGHRLRKTR